MSGGDDDDDDDDFLFTTIRPSLLLPMELEMDLEKIDDLLVDIMMQDKRKEERI